MRRYKLLIAYDGTNYCGWQVQPGVDTIQSRLQNALSIVLREPISITGAGRTDAGVHALGQVAHFQCHCQFSLEKLRMSLNALLPKDIRILDSEEVSHSFHAQYSAKSKIYQYRLSLGPVLPPLRRFHYTHIYEPLDLELLQQAASFFIGRHDFTTFANSAREGSAARGAVRELYRLDILKQNDEVLLEFEGNGFLYKMVRNIVGTLLEVAAKKRAAEDIPQLLLARDRRLAGKAAAGQGLCLFHINYTMPKSLAHADMLLMESL